MDTDTRVQEKKDRLLGALEKGLVQVHLDARRAGVIVPQSFKSESHLVLNLSYRFDPPDLSVSEWGVRETLSFGGERCTVGIPWSALYAIASQVTREFWMYPDDMPEELLKGAMDKHSVPPPVGSAPLDPASPRAILREVVIEKKPADDDAETKDPTPPKRGHLQVVK